MNFYKAFLSLSTVIIISVVVKGADMSDNESMKELNQANDVMVNVKIPHPLPDYVVINDDTIPEAKRALLRVPSQEVQFPLSLEDQTIVKILEEKNAETGKNVSGIAAPQLGYNKRIIVFMVDEDQVTKELFPDFEQTMPKTIWINPTYYPITEKMNLGPEGCLSVKDKIGLVKRFAKIAYSAYLPDGTFVQGEAAGFLARILQHEIDHINGILFIDKAEPDSLMTREQFWAKRTDNH